MSRPGKKTRNKVLGPLFLAVGLLCTALGVLGIFLPLLPTVPFLLLAAACFARGSDRCYAWLVNHRHLGPMVQGYLEGRGIPLRAKIVALGLIWLTIPASVVLVIPVPWVKVLLLGIALGVSIYLIRLPLRED